MIQASQLAFDGKTRLYRWFVYFGPTKLVTWAETAELAKLKAEKRPSFAKFRLKADKVEPAPGLE